MKIETHYNSIRYTLSNDDLSVGDEVYYMARGRIDDDNEFILNQLEFSKHISGFPDDPAIIENLNYSSFKPYEVKTNKGWSSKEAYFKIIKKEKQVDDSYGRIKTTKWVEIK
jgi:hypothetical protein